MKFYSTIFIMFIILSCGGDNDEENYEIPNLKENIIHLLMPESVLKKI
jgi:hypothetical protein